jgi:transposase-like protein
MDGSSETRIPAKRRSHSSQFKTLVVEEAQQPGVSIAAVAQRHNLNANLIHKWSREPQRKLTRSSNLPSFVPISAPLSGSSQRPTDVRIELPAAQGIVKLFWPSDQCYTLAQFVKHLQ